MKILVLEPSVDRYDFYRNILTEVADKKDIYFFASGKGLTDFFENTLPTTQEHIDILISEFSLPDSEFKEILSSVRNSYDTYSNNNFKLSALPIILHTSHETQSDFENLNIDLLSPKPKNDSEVKLSSQVKSVVKSWRMKIFDDLEVLGIGLDYDFSQVGTGYSVKVKSEKSKILSASFLIKQQALPYLWLNKNFFEFEESIDELEKLITIYIEYPREKLQRMNWEAQLQDFFNRNPKFIFQNNFEQFWSNPQFNYQDSRRSIKPDLIAKPIISPELGKNWDIVDLKLPIQEFLQKTDFHRTFTAKFQKYLTQIKNYQSYFNDDRNKQTISKLLNFHPKNPKLTLVLGRRNVLLEKQDELYHNLNTNGSAHVYLLTYDEVLDSQKRELERLLNNRLF